MGKIFYIMGKSASGKDRIYSLLEDQRELKLKTLVLYTTRPIRDGEENGKNYYFVSDEKLNEFRKNGNVIEERSYHTVYGIWTYFTADDGQVNLTESDYLGIGTLESFMKLKKYYGECSLSCLYTGGGWRAAFQSIKEGKRTGESQIRGNVQKIYC